MFACPGGREVIAAGHRQQIAADLWMAKIEPDPTGYAARTRPQLGHFTARHRRRKRRYHPEEGSQLAVDLAHIVQQCSGDHRPCCTVAQRLHGAPSNPGGVTAILSAHTAPQGDLTFDEMGRRPLVVGFRGADRQDRTEESLC